MLIYTIMEVIASYLLMLQKYLNSKEKKSEIKDYPLCLGNISKDFIINKMKKTGLKRIVKNFSVDFNPIDTNNILDVYKYLLRTT